MFQRRLKPAETDAPCGMDPAESFALLKSGAAQIISEAELRAETRR